MKESQLICICKGKSWVSTEELQEGGNSSRHQNRWWRWCHELCSIEQPKSGLERDKKKSKRRKDVVLYDTSLKGPYFYTGFRLDTHKRMFFIFCFFYKCINICILLNKSKNTKSSVKPQDQPILKPVVQYFKDGGIICGLWD